jgi:2-methylcitrate dehydratase PrpD
MQVPAVLRERAKMRLVRDPDLERLLPSRVSIVEVTLTDGPKLTERVYAAAPTGSKITALVLDWIAQDLVAGFDSPGFAVAGSSSKCAFASTVW